MCWLQCVPARLLNSQPFFSHLSLQACLFCLPAATIQGLIGSATGQAKLDCDAAGTCAIILQGLPISQLDATCQAGECLVPTTSSLNTTEGAGALF
jgi:hypothetical protein